MYRACASNSTHAEPATSRAIRDHSALVVGQARLTAQFADMGSDGAETSPFSPAISTRPVVRSLKQELNSTDLRALPAEEQDCAPGRLPDMVCCDLGSDTGRACRVDRRRPSNTAQCQMPDASWIYGARQRGRGILAILAILAILRILGKRVLLRSEWTGTGTGTSVPESGCVRV